MGELLTKVTADFLSVREGVGKGLAGKDEKEIGAASHVLISVAGAIGAVSTQEAAQALNKASHHGSWSEITVHADTCLTNIEELLRFVQGKILR